VDWFERAVKLAPDNELYVMSYETAVEERAAATGRTAAIAGEGGASSRRKASAAPEAMRVSHESHDDMPLSGRRGPCAATVLQESKDDAQASFDGAGASGLLAAKALIDRGGAALAAGATETARGYFDRALKAAPDDEAVRITAAVTALRHDELDLAAELAENGLEQFPESPGLYRVSGTARYRRGDLQAAKSSLQTALALDNRSGLSYFLLGSTLAKLGQAQAAEWHLSQARRLDPRFTSRR
jgi:tetratricopeptide (TPR) repeat protein